MTTTEAQNKAFILEAFDALFNKRDYAAAERFWSPAYIQHSAHIAPGREGLFELVTMYQHDMERYRLKFESEGFDTQVIDGHDVAAVLAALDRAKTVKGRPQAIVARTIKGHGFSLVADKLNWHGKPFSNEQLAAAIQEMGGGPTVPPDPGKSW